MTTTNFMADINGSGFGTLLASADVSFVSLVSLVDLVTGPFPKVKTLEIRYTR